MHTKVPLPTDNIYKFYAMFGLFLMFLSMWAFVTTYNTYLERSFSLTEELETLNSLKELSQKQKSRKIVLEKQKEIDPLNKSFFMQFVGGGIGASIVLMIFGFYKWHTKIQPIQDKTAAVHLQKLELEVKTLNKQFNGTRNSWLRSLRSRV
jgi:hypothetical protein